MCGRYTLTQAERLEEIYAQREMNFSPRYNVSPTQEMPIVLNESPDTLIAARWGLLPIWATDAAMAYKTINAKVETVETLRSYKVPFRERRCLVPADGFYEWQPLPAKKKQPYRFIVNSGEIFYFAGLWENSKDKEGKPMRTYTIITGPANGTVQPVHNRMPIILRPEFLGEWQAPETPIPRLKEILQSFPEELMKAYPVSTNVGSPRNDTPSLVEPVGSAEGAPFANEQMTFDSL